MSQSELSPEKLMAYLDGEMGEEEAQAFRALLDAHPEWRDEAAQLSSVVEAAESLRFRPPPESLWDSYWEEIDSRLSKKTGWLVLTAGGCLLAILGAAKILMFAENLWVRTGLVLVLAGLAILFLGVLRGRLIEMSHDRYRRVRR